MPLKGTKRSGKSSSLERVFFAYSGEAVTGVGDEHARLANSSVADRDAFYEPRRAHSQPESTHF